MGYSWTTINAGDEVAATIYSELKTNIDDLYVNHLLLSTYSWSELPVATNDEITSAQQYELRNAIDNADDQNYCRTDQSANNITVTPASNTSYFNSNNVTYNTHGHYGYHNTSDTW
jgi:hypothetical protein